jgi:hypothetical protein
MLWRLANAELRMKMTRCLLPLVLMAALGCGDGRVKLPSAPVTGMVSYQGKPLGMGRVIFLHPSGQAAAASLSAKGTFELVAFQGKNQVAIQCCESAQSASSAETGAVGWPVKSLIPRRYAEFATSGLTFDVEHGENNKAEFTLKD